MVPIERFLRHVEVEGPLIVETRCWVWTGAKFSNGYGNFRVSAAKNMNAHRWLWEHEHGAIPTGLMLCHRCDNPPCVRPSHMFVGSQRDNIADMHAKQRAGDCRNFGERNGFAKLTWDQVGEMRERHANGERVADLARAFGVTAPTAWKVVKYRTWII